MIKKTLFFVFALLAFVLAIWFVFKQTKAGQEPRILPLTKSWETPVPHQTVPKGLVSLSANACGACHQEHLAEWQLSTHAHAWTDLQFQAELKKSSSPFMCINCHIPLQNQQDSIVKGLVDGDIYKPVKVKNPNFDAALKQEGITCASCHVRDGAIVGVNGYFEAPHPVKKDAAHLSEQLCIGCHNATAELTATLVCTFETADEWKAGPYYGKKNCIDCHMETVSRPLVAGYPVRKSHRHYFPGSGIPKFDTVQTKILNGIVFVPETPKKSLRVSDSLVFKIKAINANAGHRVPSGDPERFMIIHTEVLDVNNKTMAKQEDRIGEKWVWWPKAKKLADNNMYPGEERSYRLVQKNLQPGKYILKTWVTKHRIDDAAADYNKLGKNYPRFIEIFRKEYNFTVR